MADYSHYRCLRIEVADKLATVSFNREAERNSMNREFIHELKTIWVDLSEDDEVNAVLLTGSGKYFSVGGDVKAMGDRPGGDVLKEGEMHDPAKGRRLIHNLLSIDKPIVCAINGDAIGLAATIALFCDITIAVDSARIGDPHVRIGLVAGDGGAVIWPLLVGISRAKEYLLRGTLIKAPEAERIGLINHCLPADQVMPKALEIARELAQGATWAIRGTKASVNLALKQQVGLILDTSEALEINTFHTDDHKEATRAFAEKRQPKFTGR